MEDIKLDDRLINWVAEAIANKVESLPTVDSNHHSDLSRAIAEVLRQPLNSYLPENLPKNPNILYHALNKN